MVSVLNVAMVYLYMQQYSKYFKSICVVSQGRKKKATAILMQTLILLGNK